MQLYVNSSLDTVSEKGNRKFKRMLEQKYNILTFLNFKE